MALFLQHDTLNVLLLTLSAAVQAALLATVLGVPLALWLHTIQRGRVLARLFVLLPLAMPPVVAGLALAAAFGNNGALSPILDAVGLNLSFTFQAVVIAHTFVALPFVVVTVDTALRQLDRGVTSSAASLGMSPARVITHIVLPEIFPAIVTGAALALARSLGEFGTTMTFAGSLPGVTRTMSVAIYLEREIDQGAAYILAAILVLVAAFVLMLGSLPGLLRRQVAAQVFPTNRPDAQLLRQLTQPPHVCDLSFGGIILSSGRLCAVVGPNGSGKSTLLATAAGLVRGVEVHEDNRAVTLKAAHQRNSALVTQHPSLPRSSTVLRAITMVCRDKERARHLIQAAGLQELTNIKISALSGGQAAQVALVRALSARKAVLLLDEPLAALDVKATSDWRAVITEVARDRAVALVTHDPLDVATLASDVAVVSHGRVVSQQTTTCAIEQPSTEFFARLMGSSRLIGRVEAVDQTAADILVEALQIRGVHCPDAWTPGDEVALTVPASSIRVRPATGPEADGRVVATEAISAHRGYVHVAVGKQRLIAETSLSDLAEHCGPGSSVSLDINPSSVSIFSSRNSAERVTP
ncbi:hypothetical protein GCM10028828_02690 [Corynebacterium tapiri]